ncbi:MAG: hypothetical protein ACLQDY_17690 [Streptosporangiaceae bacterium]
MTTSWVTKIGHAFAARHGRIQIMECEEIKYLCRSFPAPRCGRPRRALTRQGSQVVVSC